MTPPRDVHFYLHDALRERVLARDHNFINMFTDVLESAGFNVTICDDSLEEKLLAQTRPGYSVVLMDPPLNERGLTIRLTYFYPFWHIEKHQERWLWPVAKADFNPADCPPAQVNPFVTFWRKKHFGKTTPRRDKYVYVPLQGQLLLQRSFQFCSPLEMITQVLEHEPDRQIIAGLHPKEKYTDAERRALGALVKQSPRLSIVTGQAAEYLPHCDYVVTQNSAAALSGYFLHKPAVLFGKIDFHHIAAKVHDIGAEAAIRQAPQMTPDFDAYLWWFLQKMAINAGRPEAQDKISDILRTHGWPI